MSVWLDEFLKRRIRDVFEPRYGRGLLDDEIIQIGENLAGLMETILKFEWRLKYGNKT